MPWHESAKYTSRQASNLQPSAPQCRNTRVRSRGEPRGERLLQSRRAGKRAVFNRAHLSAITSRRAVLEAVKPSGGPPSAGRASVPQQESAKQREAGEPRGEQPSEHASGAERRAAFSRAHLRVAAREREAGELRGEQPSENRRVELRAEQLSAERTSQCRSTRVRGGRAERRVGLLRAPHAAARESAKQAIGGANSRPAELPVPQHESARQSSREASSLQPSHRCRSSCRSAARGVGPWGVGSWGVAVGR